MIIKGKTFYVHDIEIFPNLFICGVLNTETVEIITFEVSARKNNIADFSTTYYIEVLLFALNSPFLK